MEGFIFQPTPHHSGVRHLKKNPATRVTYLDGTAFAVVVHGTGRLVREHDANFDIDSLQEIVFVRVDPEFMFTHAS